MNANLEILRRGTNQDVDILKPEEMNSILGGTIKCAQGYRHSLIYGTKCDCGYDNGNIQPPPPSPPPQNP